MSSSFAAQLDGTGSPGPGAPPATPTVPIADRFHSAPVVLQSDEHRNGAFVPAGLDRSYWDSVVSDKLDPALVAAPTSSTAHSPQQRQGQPAMPFGRPSQSIVMPASPGSAALAAGASPSPPPPNLAPPPHVPVAPGPVSQLPVANRDGPPRRDSWLSNPLPALPAHLQATMELGVHVPRPGQLEPAPSASRSANVISSGTKVRGDRQQCVQSILEPLDLPPLPAAVEGHLENANAGSPARAHPRGTYVGFEDRYEILREIGEGSYGAVYEVASRVPIAGHPKGSIFVAKRLKSTAGELGYFGPLAPERAHLQNRDVVCVLREPIVVRFLPPGHPHLVRFMEVIGKKINGCIVDSAYDSIHVQALYEFELLSDDAWIIMRNEGIDLEIYLKDFPSGLPPDLAKELMSQILLGIGAVHASKLTHRDLKPRNILIHDGRARVCDFGLARRTDVHSDTRTVMIGTAYFRSFETAMLCPDHGPASDINVAGTILVRLLTGYKVGQYFRDEHERMLERDREEGSQNNESKRYMRFVQGDPDLHVLKDCFRLFGAPVGDAEDYVIDSLKKRDPIFQLEVFACLESLRGQPPAIDALLLERGYDSSCGVRGLLEGLMHLFPWKRLSAEEALQHPFLYGVAAKDNTITEEEEKLLPKFVQDQRRRARGQAVGQLKAAIEPVEVEESREAVALVRPAAAPAIDSFDDRFVCDGTDGVHAEDLTAGDGGLEVHGRGVLQSALSPTTFGAAGSADPKSEVQPGKGAASAGPASLKPVRGGRTAGRRGGVAKRTGSARATNLDPAELDTEDLLPLPKVTSRRRQVVKTEDDVAGYLRKGAPRKPKMHLVFDADHPLEDDLLRLPSRIGAAADKKIFGDSGAKSWKKPVPKLAAASDALARTLVEGTALSREAQSDEQHEDVSRTVFPHRCA